MSSYLCQEHSPRSTWCRTGACLCLCVSVRVSMLRAARGGNTEKQHGTMRSCLFACLPRWALEEGRGKNNGLGGRCSGGKIDLQDRGVKGQVYS